MLSELILLQNKSHRVQANSEAEWNQLSHVIQQDRQARVKSNRYYLTSFRFPCLPPHRLHLPSAAQEALAAAKPALWQENARQQEIEERERRTQGLVKAEIGGQRRATAVGWGLARNKAAQNASAMRMAQLTDDFAAVQAAIGVQIPQEL